MYHCLLMTPSEKIRAWLDLCDFTFKLTKDNLGEKTFFDKLGRIRKDKLKADYHMLRNLGRAK